MSKNIHCDIAILGGGAGGLSLAAGASQMGAKVVLIEPSLMGGDCLNYGCVPSKSLLSAAKAYWHASNSQALGVKTKPELDFTQVMNHVRNVINDISKNDSVERFEKLGVQVIQKAGKFINPKTFKIGNDLIHAKRFVIATGSSPFVPPIPGLDQTQYETNETIFSLKTQPKHLIVIGGGPIGCELAQAFAMLGTQVTILEAFKILPNDDADCVDIIRKKFELMNIVIHEDIKIQNINQQTVSIKNNGKMIDIQGSHILVATGRRANVNHLDLEKAGVQYSPKGIEVDKRLRSSNKKIYAIGDVAGGFQFTHIASYHASIVLKNILFRWPAKVDYRAVPWVTYTEPEMAHVGLLAKDAEKRSELKITESAFSNNDRAQAEHHIIGKIKVITNKKAQILGVTIVGAHAGELILPWVIAVREKKTLRTFTDTIVPYPTFSEISKRVAGEFYAPTLFSDKVKRLVKLLL